MAKKKNTKKEINFALLIIALVCVVIIYSINRLLFFRPLLWLVACIFLVGFFKQFIKINFKEYILATIFLLLASIVVDGIIVSIFNRIPAFTYNVVSSEKINIYYSPGLRVWQCDKNKYKHLIVDQFYNKGYVCDVEDIATIDSNSFLNSVVENYEDYKNQFVKIKGKISTKNSRTSIEMRPYIQSEIKVNGYVEFSKSIVLKIFFAQQEPALDEYDVYDDITVVGLIKNINNNNGEYIVYMDNAKILSSIDLKDFEISVTSAAKCNNEKTLLISHGNKDIYSYCLSEIFVSYGTITNELVDSISSDKISTKDLYRGYRNYESDEDGNILYDMGSYKVLVCDEDTSRDVIIGRTKMKLSDNLCTPVSEQ